MVNHRFPHPFVATMASVVFALGLSGCSGQKSPATPTTSTVAVVGQPTEAPTVVIDPAPVVTEAG